MSSSDHVQKQTNEFKDKENETRNLVTSKVYVLGTYLSLLESMGLFPSEGLNDLHI